MSNQVPKKDKSYLPKTWGSGKKKTGGPAKDETAAAPGSPPPKEKHRSRPRSERPPKQKKPPRREENESVEPGEEAALMLEDEERFVDPFGSVAPAEGPHKPPTDSEPKRPVVVVGIRFGYACKIYNFDADDIPLQMGDRVVVKTEKGMGMGLVAIPPTLKQLEISQIENLRKILRKAGKLDFDQKERCSDREAEAYAFCVERVDTLELPMKLVSVECFFDLSKYVFYFTADGRVDFRELVKQLVARFPVRIEMRQIGVRHEAKMTGGLACCGQELCCSRFLTDFRPVSVRMAKNQNLSLNPTKISGVCGRLMCCLSYEHDIYEEFKKSLPKVGKTIQTEKGEGIVIKHNPLMESVSVKLNDDTVIELAKHEVVIQPETACGKKQCRKSDQAAPKQIPTDPTPDASNEQ